MTWLKRLWRRWFGPKHLYSVTNILPKWTKEQKAQIRKEYSQIWVLGGTTYHYRNWFRKSTLHFRPKKWWEIWKRPIQLNLNDSKKEKTNND
jgi:hypothetical protein